VGVRPANFNALVDGRFPHERTSAGRALKPVAGRADVECVTPLVWRSHLGAGVLAAGAVLLLPAVPESVLVMVPYFRDPELSLVELVVSLAYPVGDALLLALASALAVAGGKRVVAYWLLVGNLVVTLVADTAFPVLALRGADTAPVDAGYVIGYILLGAAALHPSMAALSEPAPERRARLGRGRLRAMGAAALVAPALLVVEHLQGTPIEAAAVAGGWAALLVLVAARVVGLVRDMEQAETERRSLFDRTLQASEQERIQVAADLLRRAYPAPDRAGLRAGARQAAAAGRPAGGGHPAGPGAGRALGRGPGAAPADDVAAPAGAGRGRPGGRPRRPARPVRRRSGSTARCGWPWTAAWTASWRPATRCAWRSATTGRLPAGAELGAGPRRPLRPGGHARAGGDDRGSLQVDARPGGGVTLRASFAVPSAA
jgi:hypothetical protein